MQTTGKEMARKYDPTRAQTGEGTEFNYVYASSRRRPYS